MEQTIPRYRLPPIEIDPVETQIWEADGGGKGPDLAIVGGFELSKTLNNSFVEFCWKVAPSYLMTPSKEGAHHWWDDELPWKLLVMVWLSLDVDASHVLFWFKWLMCLRKEASWISGVSQFVKWMSWFRLGGNISYYINLNDTTLLQISFLFTRVPLCFKCIQNHLSWVMSDSPNNVSTSNFMFPSRKWVKSLLISKRALKNSILHVGNPIGLLGRGLGGFGAFWSSQLLRLSG